MNTNSVKYILLLGGLIAIIYSASLCTAYAEKQLHRDKTVYEYYTKQPVPEHLSSPYTTIHKYVAGHRTDSELICPGYGENKTVLILVTSALDHFLSRMAIRKTWGSYKMNKEILVGFFLGSTTNNTLQRQIDEESKLFQDIIQGNFIDSYMNLTLKSISLLEWSYKHCPNAEYILKTDDDAFINVPNLLEIISGFNKEEKVIYGDVARKWYTHRQNFSKYYIPQYEFNSTRLPDFTVGVAYLIPSSIAYELFESALNNIFVRLEDVYLTGISTKGTNITLRNIPKFVNKKITYSVCDVKTSTVCHLKQAFSNQLKLWEMLKKNNVKC